VILLALFLPLIFTWGRPAFEFDPAAYAAAITPPGGSLTAVEQSRPERLTIVSKAQNITTETNSDSAAQNGASGQDVYVSPFGDEPRSAPTMSSDGYLENGWLIWEALMPEGWDPVAIFEELNINDMADDDPRLEQVIETFLQKWNDAPVNSDLDRQPIKIPGFVVPLDFDSEMVDEFFLVPFFGACIHVPPPPPNQIIMVRLNAPIAGLGAMEVVWVYGKISIDRYTNDLGSAGYTMTADRVEFYQLGQEG
jgi:hypothetical protein